MERRGAQAVMLFVCGGVLYPSLEVLFRGRTHPSMAVAGALCALLIYFVNVFASRRSFLLRTLLSTLVVLAVEFCFGVVCNLALGLGVWDYSNRPPHLLGQVCLSYALLWFGLSAVLVFVIARLEGERAATAGEKDF